MVGTRVSAFGRAAGYCLLGGFALFAWLALLVIAFYNYDQPDRDATAGEQVVVWAFAAPLVVLIAAPFLLWLRPAWRRRWWALPLAAVAANVASYFSLIDQDAAYAWGDTTLTVVVLVAVLATPIGAVVAARSRPV